MFSPSFNDAYVYSVLQGGRSHPFQDSCLGNRGQRSLSGYSPWRCKESDTAGQLSTLRTQCIVEGQRAQRVRLLGSYCRRVFPPNAPRNRLEGESVPASVSLFSLPLQNLCPGCVYRNIPTMWPRGQFWNTEGCRTSVSQTSRNKLAEMPDRTFSPSSRQMLFSLPKRRMTLCPRAQTFMVIAMQLLILDVLAREGWEAAVFY